MIEMKVITDDTEQLINLLAMIRLSNDDFKVQPFGKLQGPKLRPPYAGPSTARSHFLFFGSSPKL